MRNPMRLVLLVSVGGGFAACRHPESRRPVVGVTLPGDSSVYSRDARRGLQQAAESLGFDLSIVTVAGDRDTAGQSSQVAAFVARGVDAIVIAAPGPDAVVGAIGAANHAGIPVFTAGFAVDGGSVADGSVAPRVKAKA